VTNSIDYQQGRRHHSSWGGGHEPPPFSNFSVFTVLPPPPPSNALPPHLQIRGAALDYQYIIVSFLPRYLLINYCRSVSADARPCRLHSGSNGQLMVPATKTNCGARSFAVAEPPIWNRLPESMDAQLVNIIRRI